MKNVVIIIIDSLRYDCLTCVADKRFLQKYAVEHLLQTPTLDGLAEQGVLFEQAITTATHTPIAVSSLFTGTYPPRHGVRSFYGGPIPTSVPTVWELFANAGYDTVFYRDNLLNPQQKDGLGDFVWDWNGSSRGCRHRVTIGADDLFQLLNDRVDRPCLLIAHFFDVHAPYLAAPYLFDRHERRFFDYINGWHERLESGPKFDSSAEASFEELVAAFQAFHKPFFSMGLANPVESLLPMYVEGVSKFDQGHLAYFIDGLRQLKLLDDALTVILADHGEAEQAIPKTGLRTFGHGCPPLEGGTRIPLILYSPQHLPHGRRISAQVSIIDVLPTALGFAGIARPASVQGVSLLPLIEGRSAAGSPGYTERSTHLFGDLTTDDFRRQSIRAGRIVNHESFVLERSLREGEFRYIEQGDELPEEDRSASAREFYRLLFRRILGARENESLLLDFAVQFGMTARRRRYHLWSSKLISLSSRLIRKVHKNFVPPSSFDQIVEWFERSRIPREKVIDCFERYARLHDKYQLYDIAHDPDQQVNLLALDPARYVPLSQPIKDKMANISRDISTGTGQEGYESHDMEIILKRLEQLGYL